MALAEDERPGLPQWTLGERLAKARHHAGLEQGDMARLLGVSRQTIGFWETGRTRPRDFMAVIREWGEATQVPVAWLLDLDGASCLPSLEDQTSFLLPDGSEAFDFLRHPAGFRSVA